ncbi:hypothetical protein K438DRAFT_1799773 [Mycena galopus ATCC 62051]|nr:hypothetical protein K438DRAFT_1799773 [Mycena galopus ATCC 62051]
MSRPRPSILQLFDPLSAQPADCDKENSSPFPDFFAPTYVQRSSPVRLTRRLVEVGDVTVEVGEVDEEDEGESEDEEDENVTIGPHPPPSPRTPLADVTFDRERTPMRSKTYRRKANAGESAVSNPPSDACGSQESDSSPNGNADTLSTSLATLSLATPTGSLIADTTMAFPTPSRLRRLLSSSSAVNGISSFALHMNMNCETSFDLLNDRISFLGHGDEESFDMGRVLVPISEQEDLEEPGENSESLANVDSEPCFVVPSAGWSPPRPGSPLAHLSDVAPESLVTDTSAILIQPPIASSLPPVFVAPPPVTHCSPPRVLSTSLPEPPALVPALKIVKRTRLETPTVPHVTAQTAPVNNPSSPEPDPPAHNPAFTTVPSAGRYVMEGPGPRRVPISSKDKEKKVAVAANHQKITVVSQPQTTASLKRPLRTVPPSGATSGLPRAVSTSRLPIPKSKIPPPTAGTGIPRRKVGS